MGNTTYKNHTISIHRNESPMNPWEYWDDLPPMAACCLGSRAHISGEYGLEVAYPHFTPKEIEKNDPQVLYVLQRLANDCSGKDIEDIINYHSYYTYSEADTKVINGVIERHFEYLPLRKQLKMLADVYSIKGYRVLSTTTRGCSQDDYAELLLVATPEYLEKIGKKSVTVEELEEAAKLYGHWYWHWARGDVYYYNIDGKYSDYIGSCDRFYGSDHEKSGLLERARKDIDCAISRGENIRKDKAIKIAVKKIRKARKKTSMVETAEHAAIDDILTRLLDIENYFTI